MHYRYFFLTGFILALADSYQFEFDNKTDSFLRKTLLNLLCSINAREFFIYYEQNVDISFLDEFIKQCSHRMAPIRSIGVIPIL